MYCGILFILFYFFSIHSWAYPDFISYGYKNCVMCHYNSQGSGPLTDYGRALFSQEIAARNFWTPKSITDEEVAEKKSGFITGTELPSWFRPAIKYRGLWFQTNPNSQNSVTRWINMQTDIDVAFHFDEAAKTVLVLNYGLLAKTGVDYYGNGKKWDAISREHYFRFYAAEKLLVATGLMDKAYGLRTSDHTSFSRGAIGLGQDDQVHGVLLHWLDENWDASVHFYAGNLSQPVALRKVGGAAFYEYSLSEKNRMGVSFLTEKNDSLDSKRFAIHDRIGFANAPGSSLLVEMGLKQDQPFSGVSKLGSYGLIQSLIKLARGYNLLTSIEHSQSETGFAAPELQRWTFGLLMFPLQRMEVRTTAVQIKNFSPEIVSKDQWQLQGQVHVSF